MSMRKHTGMAAITFAVLIYGIPNRSDAAFINYSESVTGTGVLGSTNYTNALITITGTGDTNNLISPRAGVFSIALTGRVTIGGLGSATITDSFLVFVSQPANLVGFADNTVQRDTLELINSSVASYDLTTPIGPITGPVNFADPGAQSPISTTSGAFRITSTTTPATFSASAAVPEPSSLALSGVAGLIGLGIANVRRKRAIEGS